MTTLNKGEDIKDTEIRIIGAGSANKKNKIKFPSYIWVVSLFVFIVLIIVFSLIMLSVQNHRHEIGVFEQDVIASHNPHPLAGWFSSLDSLDVSGCITKDTVVNDIPLRIYVPFGCQTPHLEVGYRCLNDTNKNVMFFQAADVRADNGKIVGAFVLHGKPLSWGLSKRGFCGIIGDQVTVGVADNSPLFEEATDQNGYFFRQYPLVDNGVLVENELKTKYTRRSLCSLEGHVVVVESLSAESLHDFAQALVDISVDNAIYLVGGGAIGWIRDTDGVGHVSGLWEPRAYKNVSFIVWQQ